MGKKPKSHNYINNNDEPYLTLANAIVRQAVDDYKRYAKNLIARQHSDTFTRELISRIKHLEYFFTKSAWGTMLNRGTGEYIVDRLHKEFYEEYGINISELLQNETKKQ